jgi:Ca2+-binding RTX toxin-like protein
VSGLRRRGVKRLARALVLAPVIAVAIGISPGAQATHATNPDIDKVCHGIATFSDALDGLVTFEEIAQALPLTELNLGENEALRLAELLNDALEEKLVGAGSDCPGTVADLQTRLNALDDASLFGDSNFDFTINGATVTDPAGANKIVVHLPIDVARTVTVPLDHQQGAVSLKGGSLTLPLSLKTTLDFELDKSLLTNADPTDDDLAFYLSAPPTIQLGVGRAPDPPATLSATFNASFGFVDLSASVTGTADLGIDVLVRDPDNPTGAVGVGDGKITQRDLVTTSLADLVDVDFVDGSDFNATVNLDTNLLSGNPDGTIVFAGDLDDGDPGVTTNLGELLKFDNISKADVIAGVTQLAQGLLSIQGVGDAKLPFVDMTLSEAFSAAQPLIKFLATMNDVKVTCGTDPGNTTTLPSGSTTNLAGGTDVYCRATTDFTVQSGTVAWTVPTGVPATTIADGTNNATVATNPAVPATNAHFRMSSSGNFDVDVKFNEPEPDPDPSASTIEGTLREGSKSAETAKELLQKLARAAGFNSAESNIQYDQTNDALTFHLTKSGIDPAPFQGAFDFGDQLKAATNIVGLTPTATADASIDVSGVAVDVTFGIILVGDTADITPTAGTAPSLADRFFIKVNNGSGAHEVTVNDLTATLNAELRGKIGFLEVAAHGSAAESPTGSTAFSIEKKTVGTPVMSVDIETPDAPIEIQGKPGISDAILLTELLSDPAGSLDAACNVKMEAGLEVDATVGGQELASAGVALDWPDVFGADCIPDLGGLSIDPSADFNDELFNFDINPSNPAEILSLILDNIDSIAAALDAVGIADLDTEVPIIGGTLRDRLNQLQALRNKLNLIRTGGTGEGVINCGTAESGGGAPTGDASLVNADPDDTTDVYCRATFTPEGTITSATWTPTGAVAKANDTGAGALTTVGTTPGDNAEFEVTDETGTFTVQLSYTDDAGAHTLDWPAPGVPESLQELEDTIEEVLGLPEAALAVTLSDVDGNSKQDLIFRLGYGVCTPAYDPNGADAGNVCDNAYKLPEKLEQSLNLSLGDLELVGLQSGGVARVDFSGIAQLNFGVELESFNIADPAAAVFVLDSSKLEATLRPVIEGFDLTGSVGPITVGIQGGDAKFNSAFSLKDDSATATETKVSALTDLTDFTLAAEPNVNCGDVDPDGTGTGVDPIVLEGDACARLPLFVNGTGVGSVGFYIEDGEIGNPVIGDGSAAAHTWIFVVPDDLLAELAGALLDFDLVFEGLNFLLDELEAQLRASEHNVTIPLIGGDLTAGADLIQSFQTGILDPLQDLTNRLDGLGAGEIRSCVEGLLEDALGDDSVGPPTTCAGAALPDLDGLGLLDPSELTVNLNCGGAVCVYQTVVCEEDEDGNQVDPDCVNQTENAALDVDDLQIELTIGDPLAEGSTPFDIGLPGLRLRSTEGEVSASVDWNLHLKFGISRDDGFYVQPVAGDELSLDAQVSMPAAMQAELAFLQVDIADNEVDDGAGGTEPSNVSAEVGVDITGTDRISAGGLGDTGIAFGLTANANIDLGILTKLRGDEQAGFPSASADFALEWDPIVSVGSDGVNSSELHTSFDNVRLHPGKFLHKFLGPIVDEVKRVTSPLKPISDTLRAKIPVVSDIAEAVGQDPVTFIGLLKALGGNDLALIEDLLELYDFIQNVNVGAIAEGTPEPGDDVNGIPMGAFPLLGGAVLNGPTTPDQADDLIDSASGDYDEAADVDTATANALGPAGAGDIDSPSDVGGLRFPFLENPGQVFGMLLGKDIDLICWQPGGLRATAGFGYSFGPFMVGPVPLVVSIGGSITVGGRFELCYDSSGLRKVLVEGSSGEHLFDGIYLNDLNAAGVDVPEISLIGEVFAGAGVSVFIFEAGIEGGIRLTVDLNLDDRPNEDGKLRIEEIFNKLGNPICLFVVSGRLEAFLRAYLKINLLFTSKKVSFELVKIVLLEFEGACDPPNPVLAHKSGTTLVLNMGPDADQRGINVDEIDERFKVRQIGSGKVSVEAFGIYQEYSGITDIKAVGGDGNDTVNLEPGAGGNNADGSPILINFTLPANIWGDWEGAAPGGSDPDGNDAIKTGDGADNVRGGGGGDRISVGLGGDTVTGGDGPDQIEGEVGTDNLNGGNDEDVINGGPGGDSINGGGADDTLNGGPGLQPKTPNVVDPTNDPFDVAANNFLKDTGDTIEGGSGNDNIQGLDAVDTIYGDQNLACGDGGVLLTSGGDYIEGGPANDNLFGGAGNDHIVGKEGNDTICGNGGQDDLFGEQGDDDIFGGAGRDDIIGGPDSGGDDVEGGADADYVLADDGTINREPTAALGTVVFTPAAAGGPDRVHGQDGNDWLYGQNGGDTMTGGANNDNMFGGLGADTMDGGANNDTMEGESGVDNMDGDADADTMRGGTENDVMYGDDRDNAAAAGTDNMFGDGGLDRMHGGPSADTMSGGIDIDTMYGDAGDDLMNGDAAEDRMYGGANDDEIHGDNANDYIEGNGNADEIWGEEGEDRLVGGTTYDGSTFGGSTAAGQDDGGDTMYGGNADDVMTGDNASIAASGVETLIEEESEGGDDLMYGDNPTDPAEQGEDRMFGEFANDEIHGGPLDDYAEGNAGSDEIYGENDEDDLIGGSDVADADDAGEELVSGGAGIDYIAGDNAQITRASPRSIVLLDLNSSNADAAGDDLLHGDAANDVMYGQGENDTMHGDAGDDYMEGNTGSDEMHGGADLDDMAGGSGHDNGGDSGSVRLLDFVIDENVSGAGDQMFGDGGVDYMGGDNVHITRPIGQRLIALHNVDFAGGDSVAANLSGNDTMHGGDANDLMYGQGADDDMFGDGNDDYMEGNAGSDDMEGNAAADKMVGGSGQDNGGDAGALRKLANALDMGDDMFGNGAADALAASDGVDFMSGDNAFIVGLGDARQIELYDIPFDDLATQPDAGVAGGDTMRGNGADDVMYGQSAGDDMQGNDGDDYMEGNGAHDVMFGNADEDDMLGGSGHDDGGDPFGTLRELRNVRDVGDEMHGNTGVDYMGGDNGLMLRTDSVNEFDGSSAGREVVLYDVLIAGESVFSANVSGGDTMTGDEGNDVMFGQGNGGQSADQADPADGIDNDRDGREDGDPSNEGDAGYDCRDGLASSAFQNQPDNDGDGFVDADDPECAAAVDEDADWLGDVMNGNEGHDYMEGNHGADLMSGDADEDDLAGGGSAADGQVTDDQGSFIADRSGANMNDGHDVLRGNADDDTMAGDNAAITRPLDETGAWTSHTGGNGYDLFVRSTTMSETPEHDAAAGNDFMLGNDGHDDMFGQRHDDYMEGNEGEDAIVGDLGNITDSIVGGSGDGTFIDINPPFLEDNIDVPGTLDREVELFSDETGQGAEGNDIILGDDLDSETPDANDRLHGGPGDDLMNGNGPGNQANPNSLEDGEDYVFGGDGSDALWGGIGHDHIWGGWGNDYLDVAPRPYMDVNGDEVGGETPPDTPEWFEIAGEQNMQGIDYAYGGRDKDALQANVGRPGPRPGDRLIDAVGNTNIFFVCKGAYGEGVINRDELMPDMRDFLTQLSSGDGAFDTGTAGSSGFRELSLIFPGEETGNPVYPGSPGHFTCPPADPAVGAGSVSLSSSSVIAGDDVTITAVVGNEGQGVAGQVVVRFSANGKEIGRQTIEGIYEGATEQASLVWNTGNRSGEQAIEVTLDPDNAITDENEENNTATASLTIAGADLSIAPADLQLSRTNIVQGDKVTVTATVHNTSTAPARDVTVRFTDNDELIGKEQTIATIPAGGTATASVVWRTHRSSGQRTLAATVDAADSIAELDEANNAASVAVDVKSNKVKNGSYELSATGTAPDSWTASSSTSTTYVLDGEGDHIVTAGSSSFWLSESIPVAPGATCTVGVDAWGGTATLSVKQYSSTGRGVGTTSFVLQPGAAVTEYTHPVTIDAKAATATVMLIGGLNGVPTGFDTAQLSGAC